MRIELLDAYTDYLFIRSGKNGKKCCNHSNFGDAKSQTMERQWWIETRTRCSHTCNIIRLALSHKVVLRAMPNHFPQSHIFIIRWRTKTFDTLIQTSTILSSNSLHSLHFFAVFRFARLFFACKCHSYLTAQCYTD